MKRLAWVFGVCLCGCVMSVTGAEVPFSVGDGTWNQAKSVAAKETARPVSSSEKESEAAVEESEAIRKEGVPLTADPRYEQLFALSEDGKTDDGIYLVKDSIHVTDVVNDMIFATVTVVEARPEGAVRSRMEFCIDGFGKASKKGADGTYAPLPEKAPMAEYLAEEAVLSAFGDDARWEGFLREMQEIAIRKAGLDKPTSPSGEATDVSEEESVSAPEAERVPKEETAAPKETTPEKPKKAKKEPKLSRAPESPLWREFEKRVQSVLEEEADEQEKAAVGGQTDRTRIDVVIPPDSDTAYEEKEIEQSQQKVTVSIQTVQS